MAKTNKPKLDPVKIKQLKILYEKADKIRQELGISKHLETI